MESSADGEADRPLQGQEEGQREGEDEGDSMMKVTENGDLDLPEMVNDEDSKDQGDGGHREGQGEGDTGSTTKVTENRDLDLPELVDDEDSKGQGDGGHREGQGEADIDSTVKVTENGDLDLPELVNNKDSKGQEDGGHREGEGVSDSTTKVTENRDLDLPELVDDEDNKGQGDGGHREGQGEGDTDCTTKVTENKDLDLPELVDDEDSKGQGDEGHREGQGEGDTDSTMKVTENGDLDLPELVNGEDSKGQEDGGHREGQGEGDSNSTMKMTENRDLDLPEMVNGEDSKGQEDGGHREGQGEGDSNSTMKVTENRDLDLPELVNDEDSKGQEDGGHREGQGEGDSNSTMKVTGNGDLVLPEPVNDEDSNGQEDGGHKEFQGEGDSVMKNSVPVERRDLDLPDLVADGDSEDGGQDGGDGQGVGVTQVSAATENGDLDLPDLVSSDEDTQCEEITTSAVPHREVKVKEDDHTRYKALVTDALVALQDEDNPVRAAAKFQSAIDLWNNSDVLQSTLAESDILVLRYAHGISCLHQDSWKNVVEGLEAFQWMQRETDADSFPLVYYGLGRALTALYRFREAVDPAERGLQQADSTQEWRELHWPESQRIIQESRLHIFKRELLGLWKLCRYPPPADAVCTMHVDHEGQGTQIYFKSPSFTGYTKIHCLEKCSIAFHPHCWKHYMTAVADKTRDKDMINQVCPTPDCGSVICTIYLCRPGGKRDKEIVPDASVIQRPQRPPGNHKLGRMLPSNPDKIQCKAERKELRRQKRQAARQAGCHDDSDSNNQEHHTEGASVAVAASLTILDKERDDQSVKYHGFHRPIRAKKRKEKEKAKQVLNVEVNFSDNRQAKLLGEHDADGNSSHKVASAVSTRVAQYLQSKAEREEGTGSVTTGPHNKSAPDSTIMDHLLEYFAGILSERGPLHLNDPVLAQEFGELPDEARRVVARLGGPPNFFRSSRRFVVIRDVVANIQDSKRAHKLAHGMQGAQDLAHSTQGAWRQDGSPSSAAELSSSPSVTRGGASPTQTSSSSSSDSAACPSPRSSPLTRAIFTSARTLPESSHAALYAGAMTSSGALYASAMTSPGAVYAGAVASPGAVYACTMGSMPSSSSYGAVYPGSLYTAVYPGAVYPNSSAVYPATVTAPLTGQRTVVRSQWTSGDVYPPSLSSSPSSCGDDRGSPAVDTLSGLSRTSSDASLTVQTCADSGGNGIVGNVAAGGCDVNGGTGYSEASDSLVQAVVQHCLVQDNADYAHSSVQKNLDYARSSVPRLNPAAPVFEPSYKQTVQPAQGGGGSDSHEVDPLMLTPPSMQSRGGRCGHKRDNNDYFDEAHVAENSDEGSVACNRETGDVDENEWTPGCNDDNPIAGGHDDKCSEECNGDNFVDGHNDNNFIDEYSDDNYGSETLDRPSFDTCVGGLSARAGLDDIDDVTAPTADAVNNLDDTNQAITPSATDFVDDLDDSNIVMTTSAAHSMEALEDCNMVGSSPACAFMDELDDADVTRTTPATELQAAGDSCEVHVTYSYHGERQAGLQAAEDSNEVHVTYPYYGERQAGLQAAEDSNEVCKTYSYSADGQAEADMVSGHISQADFSQPSDMSTDSLLHAASWEPSSARGAASAQATHHAFSARPGPVAGERQMSAACVATALPASIHVGVARLPAQPPVPFPPCALVPTCRAYSGLVAGPAASRVAFSPRPLLSSPSAQSMSAPPSLSATPRPSAHPSLAAPPPLALTAGLAVAALHQQAASSTNVPASTTVVTHGRVSVAASSPSLVTSSILSPSEGWTSETGPSVTLRRTPIPPPSFSASMVADVWSKAEGTRLMNHEDKQMAEVAVQAEVDTHSVLVNTKLDLATLIRHYQQLRKDNAVLTQQLQREAEDKRAVQASLQCCQSEKASLERKLETVRQERNTAVQQTSNIQHDLNKQREERAEKVARLEEAVRSLREQNSVSSLEKGNLLLRVSELEKREQLEAERATTVEMEVVKLRLQLSVQQLEMSKSEPQRHLRYTSMYAQRCEEKGERVPDKLQEVVLYWRRVVEVYNEKRAEVQRLYNQQLAELQAGKRLADLSPLTVTPPNIPRMPESFAGLPVKGQPLALPTGDLDLQHDPTRFSPTTDSAPSIATATQSASSGAVPQPASSANVMRPLMPLRPAPPGGVPRAPLQPPRHPMPIHPIVTPAGSLAPGVSSGAGPTAFVSSNPAPISTRPAPISTKPTPMAPIMGSRPPLRLPLHTPTTTPGHPTQPTPTQVPTPSSLLARLEGARVLANGVSASLSFHNTPARVSGTDQASKSASALSTEMQVAPVRPRLPMEGGGAPRSSFDKLVASLQKSFPQCSRDDISRLIQELRREHGGSLSGMSLEFIVTCATQMLIARGIKPLGTDTPTNANNNNIDNNDNSMKPSSSGATPRVAPPPGLSAAWSVEGVGDGEGRGWVGGGCEEEDPCAICTDELTSAPTLTLECGHCFHEACIRTWFKQQTTCPNCRVHAPLFDDFPALT